LPNVTASNPGLPNSKLLNHYAVLTPGTGVLEFVDIGESHFFLMFKGLRHRMETLEV